MAADIILWPVPSDANPNDMRLRDPAYFVAVVSSGSFAHAQIVDDE